jgi:acetyltransferase-like isoleucine patch superfamily enzyme
VSAKAQAPFVVFDVFVVGLFFVLVGPPLAAAASLHGLLAEHLRGPLLWLTVPGTALVFLTLLLACVALVRLCLPRLEPGLYPFPGHRMSKAWALSFALQRLAYLPPWKPLAFGTWVFRYLFLRALGARVPYGLTTATDAQLLDCPMLEIEDGVMLAAGTILSGHIVEKEHLLLGKVRLRQGVQAHEGVKVGPNVTIGEHVVLGPESRLAPDVEVGEYAHLGAGCWLSGGSRVGANAVLGNGVILEANVKVGEGAVVQSYSRVPKGTVVPDGDRYPKAARRQESA